MDSPADDTTAVRTMAPCGLAIRAVFWPDFVTRAEGLAPLGHACEGTTAANVIRTNAVAMSTVRASRPPAARAAPAARCHPALPCGVRKKNMPRPVARLDCAQNSILIITARSSGTLIWVNSQSSRNSGILQLSALQRCLIHVKVRPRDLHHF